MNEQKARELIKEKGVPAYKIEQELGFANGLISKWLNEGITPKVTSIAKLANFLNVSIEELL